MGQQQLLLLVLATIIVGIATVVGIQAFSQNNIKSNADALVNDAVRIASDAQAWAQKSEPFGGPETYGDIGSATLPLLGYADPAVNTNGECDITAATAAADAADGSNASLEITCTNATLGNTVVLTVGGLSDEDISSTVTLGS